MDYATLPGHDLIEKGLDDLREGERSAEALLVLVGATRLRRGGVPVPEDTPVGDPERALYDLLAERFGDAAHSRYNALIRTLVSFERAMECASR